MWEPAEILQAWQLSNHHKLYTKATITNTKWHKTMHHHGSQRSKSKFVKWLEKMCHSCLQLWDHLWDIVLLLSSTSILEHCNTAIGLLLFLMHCSSHCTSAQTVVHLIFSTHIQIYLTLSLCYVTVCLCFLLRSARLSRVCELLGSKLREVRYDCSALSCLPQRWYNTPAAKHHK